MNDGIRGPSGGWNYRVVEFQLPNGESYLEVYEIWYDKKGDDGKPNGYSRATGPHGETGEEAMADLKMMQRAFELPTLKASEHNIVFESLPAGNGVKVEAFLAFLNQDDRTAEKLLVERLSPEERDAFHSELFDMSKRVADSVYTQKETLAEEEEDEATA